MTGFVRASRLYNVKTGEAVPFDWSKFQPVAENQGETERAVACIEDRR